MLRFLMCFLLSGLGLTLTAQESQNIWKGYHSEGYTIPQLTWYGGDTTLVSCIKVYRAPIDKKDYRVVATHVKILEKNDSSFIQFDDTSLIDKNIYKYKLMCRERQVSDLLYGHNLGELGVPKVMNIHIDNLKDKTALKLHWELVHPSLVTSIDLYRSAYYGKGYQRIATLGREDRSYTDFPDWANEASFYMFVVHDIFGQRPPTPPIPAIPTHDEIPFARSNVQASIVNDSIKISWKNYAKNALYYQIFAQYPNDNAFYILQNIDAYQVKNNQITLAFNHNNYGTLRLFMTAKSSGDLTSVHSDTIYVQLKSSTPPHPPIDGNVLKDSLDRNLVVWSINTDDDLDGYNIYAQQNKISLPVQLNKKLILPWENYFLDKSNKKYYSYSVTSLRDSLESKPFEIPVTNPKMSNDPINLILENHGKTVKLLWANTTKPVLYLFRMTNDAKPLLLGRHSQATNSFEDKDIPAGFNTYFLSDNKNFSAKNIISNKILFHKYAE